MKRSQVGAGLSAPRAEGTASRVLGSRPGLEKEPANGWEVGLVPNERQKLMDPLTALMVTLSRSPHAGYETLAPRRTVGR
jgi:hypothetical protein